jgi:hypothetical protein
VSNWSVPSKTRTYTLYWTITPLGFEGGCHVSSAVSEVSSSTLIPAGAPGTASKIHVIRHSCRCEEHVTARGGAEQSKLSAAQ